MPAWIMPFNGCLQLHLGQCQVSILGTFFANFFTIRLILFAEFFKISKVQTAKLKPAWPHQLDCRSGGALKPRCSLLSWRKHRVLKKIPSLLSCWTHHSDRHPEHTTRTVTLNLFQGLFLYEMLKQVQHDIMVLAAASQAEASLTASAGLPLWRCLVTALLSSFLAEASCLEKNSFLIVMLNLFRHFFNNGLIIYQHWKEPPHIQKNLVIGKITRFYINNNKQEGKTVWLEDLATTYSPVP